MNIINRVIKIITAPKKEWEVIDQENTSIQELVIKFVLVLALIPALATFIGYGVIGYNIPFVGHVPGSISFGIRQAIVSYLATVGGVFLTAFVINALASTFQAQPDMRRAMQLTVYSWIPSWIAGVFNILPSLSILAFIAGLYSLYILYIGLAPMMKVPKEKNTAYFIVSLLVMLLSSFLLGLLLAAILIGSAKPF